MTVSGCGDPQPGSLDDLGQRLDDLDVPAAMSEEDEFYIEDCPATCPSLVRWYDVVGSVETAQSSLLQAIEESGFETRTGATPGIFVASSDSHIVFVVFDAQMISGNEHAPEGTDAELSIQLLDRE